MFFVLQSWSPCICLSRILIGEKATQLHAQAGTSLFFRLFLAWMSAQCSCKSHSSHKSSASSVFLLPPPCLRTPLRATYWALQSLNVCMQLFIFVCLLCNGNPPWSHLSSPFYQPISWKESQPNTLQILNQALVLPPNPFKLLHVAPPLDANVTHPSDPH